MEAPYGSSPLARGTRVHRLHNVAAFRLIPARAGNTCSSGVRLFQYSAHPRSRGEHKTPRPGLGARFGSSPLARGTRNHVHERPALHRLIPARAGNTLVTSPSPRSTAAHPRSRGEHQMPALVQLKAVGSSPLARGTLGKVPQRCLLGRLIPARAGNTLLVIPRQITGAAHPRSRGEHYSELSSPQSEHGSSPLARGTLRLEPLLAGRVRLIPARAGNTQGRCLRRCR